MQCSAKAKRTGEQCQRSANNGGNVCQVHGGSAKHVKAAAARRLAEARASQALQRQGFRALGNPLEELQRVASEVTAVKDWLGGQVERLDEIRYTSGKAGEQMRAELAAYERALDRTIKAQETLARLDIDGRLARIEEAKLTLVAHALDLALAPLDPDIAWTVRSAFVAALGASDG